MPIPTVAGVVPLLHSHPCTVATAERQTNLSSSIVNNDINPSKPIATAYATPQAVCQISNSGFLHLAVAAFLRIGHLPWEFPSSRA